MKKVAALTMASLLISSMSFTTAFAFTDLDEGQKEAVTALKDRGIVSGIDNEHFAPKGKISYAQSIQMIVKGLDLNMDFMRFAKQPEASDIYSNIPNSAWYANAFIIAHYNGLEIPKDINPNATITREQFGDLLVRTLEKKGNFPLVKMIFIQISDEDQIIPEYQGSLQRMLLYKIAELDSNGKLNPKRELTRGEAASWVYNGVRVLADHTNEPTAEKQVTVTVEKVNDDVNKVMLSRGEKPNNGYGIEINNVQFGKDGQAVITYTLIDPKPDMMYADVITEPKASTYVSSQFKAIVERSAAN
jgi:hypothetical protein